MIDLPVNFHQDVPQRHQQSLKKKYYRYCSENWIRFYNLDLRKILSEWVSCGNDPYQSNRYGFYDSRSRRYLSFLEGEYKAVQILEIMAGKREAACCCFNSYGEPMPASGTYRVPHSSEASCSQRIIREGIPAAKNLLRIEMNQQRRKEKEE